MAALEADLEADGGPPAASAGGCSRGGIGGSQWLMQLAVAGSSAEVRAVQAEVKGCLAAPDRQR